LHVGRGVFPVPASGEAKADKGQACRSNGCETDAVWAGIH